jgi:hypothetical protein
MIVGFIGTLGSGKTLSMVREAYKYHLRGSKIMANLKLKFPYQEIDFEQLFAMAQEEIPPYEVVILLDEVHIMLDSRSAMSKVSKTMSFWTLQTRKMGVKLFYTTQYAHQIDKRLRSATDLFVQCDGVTIVRGGKEYFVCQNEIYNDNASKREIFLGNDFYHLYDTRQVIKFVTKDSASVSGRGRDSERVANGDHAGAVVLPELPLPIREESEENTQGSLF